MMHTRALLGLSLVVSLSLAACAASPESGGEETGRAHAAVIKGEPSTKAQDAVVLLVHYDPGTRSFGQCTGTLLAPRLVLTARHCVAATDPYAACNVDGEPLLAGKIRRNHKAETMYVFTGTKRPDFGRGGVEPAGQGERILDTGSKTLCNNDIALIVLKEPVKEAVIAPIRLDSDVKEGELLTAVGWGVTDRTPSPSTRQQRTGIKILSVGPEKSRPAVPPNEFQVGESICSGDSGGPAFAESTGAVVGVVSRGGNATESDPRDPASNCLRATNLYMKISPFEEMIRTGYELAEAEPWLEGEPDPRLLKPGSFCFEASECRSDLCLPDPDQAEETTCALECSESDCPEDQVCTAEGDVKVCRAPKKPNAADGKTSGMCSGAPVGSSGAGLGFAFALAALVLAGVRRRRP
jgi:hypothetical protein